MLDEIIIYEPLEVIVGAIIGVLLVFLLLRFGLPPREEE